MFSRKNWFVGVLVSSCTLMPSWVLAAEHGGKEHAGSTTATTSSTAVSQPADSSAAAPAATMGQDQMSTAPTTPSDAGQQSSGAVTAPAAVPTAPPALKPIMITFSGKLTAVDSNANPPMITVKDRYDVTKEIAVPSDAKIAQGAVAKALADLKVDENLTVAYTYDVATGKRTAQTITLGEEAAAGKS